MSVSTQDFIKDLLDLQVPHAVDLCGDGSRLVYATGAGWDGMIKTGENETRSIWLAETRKANSARRLTNGDFNDHIPKISPDGQTVVFVSDRARPGKNSAIYAMSLLGGEPYAITTAENEQSIDMLKWSPDGKHIAYLSADEKSQDRKQKDKDKDDAEVWGQGWPYNRLRVLDFATKTTSTIVSLNEHVKDLDWSVNGSSIAFATKAFPDYDAIPLGNDIYTVSASGKSLRKIAHVAGDVYSLTFTQKDIYYTGAVTPDSFHSAHAVWHMNTDGEIPSKRIAHGDTTCGSELVKFGDKVACFVQDRLQTRIELLGGNCLYEGPSGVSSWALVQPSDDVGPTIACVRSDINSPNEVWCSTKEDGDSYIKLSNHGGAITKRQLAKTASIECRTLDDADTIQGILHTPAKHANKSGVPVKPLSTIVLVHGGPYTRIVESFNPAYFYFAEVFLNAGYAVMLPNYRGSSGRGEAFAAAARGGVGVYDLPDVIALTQHCIEKDYIDKDNLIISGWSQGGFMSYLGAVRNGMHGFGWKFKGAIPGAGVTDWTSLSFASDIGYVEAEFCGVAAWNSDKDNTKDRTGSAIWEFKKAVEQKAIPPMLILHGQNDIRVTIEQARAFRRGLIHHKLPFEYVEYPREGHFVQERKHLEDMLERSLRFVQKHIKEN